MSPRKARAAEPEPAPGPDDAPVPGPEPTPEPAPPADAAPSRPRTWTAVEEHGRGVRAGLLTIAILVLGVGCIIALYAAMRIASIWFEARFVPIVQLAVAGAAIAFGIAAVRRLNRKA